LLRASSITVRILRPVKRLVFEQRLRYGLDIGPEVINEALDDGFRQR